MLSIKDGAQKLRFVVVGTINTVIDFGIFMVLSLAGMPTVVANFFSTSAGFTFSFFANKHYTFKDNSRAKKQIVLFLLVTLFGLWVLQPIIITLVKRGLVHFNWREGLVLLIAKGAATVVTLIWNYVFYSRVVFTKPKSTENLVP